MVTSPAAHSSLMQRITRSPHFMEEKTEAPRKLTRFPKATQQTRAQLGFELGSQSPSLRPPIYENYLHSFKPSEEDQCLWVGRSLPHGVHPAFHTLRKYPISLQGRQETITTGVQRQPLSYRTQTHGRYADSPMPASHQDRGNGIRFTELSMLKWISQAETVACALILVNSRHNGCHAVLSGAIWHEHTQGLHEL